MAPVTSDMFSHTQIQRFLTMAYGHNSDKFWTLSLSGCTENIVFRRLDLSPPSKTGKGGRLKWLLTPLHLKQMQF
jgi:hypothetical protein